MRRITPVIVLMCGGCVVDSADNDALTAAPPTCVESSTGVALDSADDVGFSASDVADLVVGSRSATLEYYYGMRSPSVLTFAVGEPQRRVFGHSFHQRRIPIWIARQCRT